MATVAKTIYLSGCNYQLQYDILSQSQANNTTTVRFYGVLNVTNNYVSWSTSKRVWVHYIESSYFDTYYSRGSYTLVQGDWTFTHNSNGDLTQNVGFGIDTTFISGSDSVNITFPHIDRYPMITSAPNFNDESNPTIQYTTTLGFSGATVQTAIFDSTGTTPYVSYRNVNVSNGSYTFELTTAERNALRNATPNSNTLNVMFKLRTTANGTNYFSNVTKTMTIINANPTFTYTNAEINSKVSALLGTSGSKVVQNASRLRVVTTPTALKGSSISKVVITHNNKTYTDSSSPYQLDIPITNNKFVIAVTDSRGNTTSQTITKTMISYAPVDITNLSMKRVNPTSSNIIVNLEATYYQATFGSTANVPIVKWKLDNGSYTTIPSSNYIINNTNHTLKISNYVLTNALDYRQQGQFTLYIEDKLTTDTEGGEKGKILKGIPTYDAGEHDLKVNGTLYIADQNGENKFDVGGLRGTILWTNSNPSQNFNSQTITLNKSLDNYDRYEIIFKQGTTLERCLTTGLIPVGHGTILNYVFSYPKYRNTEETVTGNSISFENCISINSFGGGVTENNSLIPLYVIGYKTNLFN